MISHTSGFQGTEDPVSTTEAAENRQLDVTGGAALSQGTQSARAALVLCHLDGVGGEQAQVPWPLPPVSPLRL